MSVDTADFSAFEEELETPAPPQEMTPPEPAVPAFSIDDLAPMEEEDLPAPDTEKEDLRRRLAAFENRPAPSPFDAPKPVAPGDARAALRAKFAEKLASGDPDAVADAFVLAAEMGAQGAEERLRGQIEASQGSMIERTIERFTNAQKTINPQLWKAIEKDFNGFMSEAQARVKSNPGASSRLNEEMVKEACNDFFERSKGRALDRYMDKATKVKREVQTPPPTPRGEAPPDYNPLSAPTNDNGKSGPLIGKDEREKRIIRDGRLAGLSDTDIRDIL